MPITISLLNSLSGVAGGIAGIAVGDIILVAIGGIVGASGLLLTSVMCKAMNRKLIGILLGATSVGGKKAEAATETAEAAEAGEEAAEEATEETAEEAVEAAPEGSVGELVFSCIDKEAFPLLRYRTRDLCRLTREQCSCGRTFVKMSRLMGRTDDMLIIRGVNVFPSQIETVLINNGYPANYQIIVDRVNNSDTLDVNVEITPEMLSDTTMGISEREKKLVADLKAMLGIKAAVHIVEPKSIARSEGKAVRIIDNRKI